MAKKKAKIKWVDQSWAHHDYKRGRGAMHKPTADEFIEAANRRLAIKRRPAK